MATTELIFIEPAPAGPVRTALAHPVEYGLLEAGCTDLGFGAVRLELWIRNTPFDNILTGAASSSHGQLLHTTLLESIDFHLLNLRTDGIRSFYAYGFTIMRFVPG